MKKNVMMGAVLGAMVVAAGVAKADDSAELKALKQQLQLQKQELADLLAKMEQIETSQQSTSAVTEATDWASRIRLNGDFRYRYELREDEDGLSKARERIRARLGLSAQVNDEVKFGMRLATGGGSTSTNETLDDNFAGKDFYLDRAYVTYSPKEVAGLDITLGRMPKPWFEASDLVFDGDLNPDGIAAQYAMGPVGLVAGTFVAEEHLNQDVRLNVLQVSGDLEPSDNVKLTLGASYFGLTNDEQSDYTELEYDSDTGTWSEETDYVFEQGYDIVEGFAVAKVKAKLPVTATAHYAVNCAADEDENAFLIGFGTQTGKWKFGYNYRRVELNSVMDALNDGDFGQGKPGWEGSKLTAGYSISKNFSAGASWFLANKEIDGDEEMDMVQLDLKAKF